ncbi:AraC family transcriptional regulator [Paenibacillus piscarius]|uniref:AraC family transcriptional regulator n=1 Tax=Paenibacillus piscarius TaxID=1089681 RepID=UPI001EE8FD3F|nr:AraC family transcriptional regulator [Paenibacillus piscarius]
MSFLEPTGARDVTLYLAHRRVSVNNELRETFHSHLGIEILYIHEGQGTIIVNNTAYELVPGMVCIFQPYQLHHVKLDYSDNRSFERSVAIFEPTLFESYFEQWPALHSFYKYIHLSKLDSPCIYGIADSAELNRIFQNMADRSASLKQGDRLEEISLFLVMLISFLKRHLTEQERQHLPFKQRKNHQIENLLTWIENHYTDTFQLDVMAKDLHLSPQYISRLFKDSIGMTITEYISGRRAHQAVLLLISSDKPVNVIAEEVGLTNPSYFCKMFKSQMGTTPHQYRKRWSV